MNEANLGLNFDKFFQLPPVDSMGSQLGETYIFVEPQEVQTPEGIQYRFVEVHDPAKIATLQRKQAGAFYNPTTGLMLLGQNNPPEIKEAFLKGRMQVRHPNGTLVPAIGCIATVEQYQAIGAVFQKQMNELLNAQKAHKDRKADAPPFHEQMTISRFEPDRIEDAPDKKGPVDGIDRRTRFTNTTQKAAHQIAALQEAKRENAAEAQKERKEQLEVRDDKRELAHDDQGRTGDARIHNEGLTEGKGKTKGLEDEEHRHPIDGGPGR